MPPADQVSPRSCAQVTDVGPGLMYEYGQANPISQVRTFSPISRLPLQAPSVTALFERSCVTELACVSGHVQDPFQHFLVLRSCSLLPTLRRNRFSLRETFSLPDN